jgi:hypothetical protein
MRKYPRLKVPTEAVDLAYIAGIVDGEGSIRSGGRSTKGRVKNRWEGWQVSVANTDAALMQYLGRIGGRVYGNRHVGPLSKKPIYSWSVYRLDEVLALLKAIRPYLIIKRGKADQAIAETQLWIWLYGIRLGNRKLPYQVPLALIAGAGKEKVFKRDARGVFRAVDS